MSVNPGQICVEKLMTAVAEKTFLFISRTDL